MSNKNLIENDDAVSISLGFILMLSITVLVFSATLLSFYTLSSQSEKTAMRESFEIMASGLAVRITTVDMLINLTSSYSGEVNALEYEFSIPATIANEGYSITISNSTKEIIIEADNGAKARVPFNTSSKIMRTTIYSNAQDYKFIYNKADNAITIEER